MYSPNQGQGLPLSITFITKFRTLSKEKINSKVSLNTLLENFRNNSIYKNQLKPKSKYILNGKEIRKTQTLEEILIQNMSDPSSSELFIELEDILYSGDASSPIFNKIMQPKQNPFGLLIFCIKDISLKLKNFPEKTINLFELNKINEGSAYCNSNEDLYISGSNDKDNKDFWIINNKDFNIKKKKMPFSKQNHSMVYLNFKENEEWVFIIGGNNKKSFYYDLKKNYFINWGDTIELHSNPALIRIGEYLYIFDSLNSKKIFFERTKIINSTRKWEKITPSINKQLLSHFPSDFSVSYDMNGNVLFLGGDNILGSNNTYIYDSIKNEITLSQKGTNDNMIFSDKTCYKVNYKYNIAFPKDLTEKKEICFVDKEDQSLMKINVQIPNENKEIIIKTRINFNDKKYLYNKDDEGTLTIKETGTKSIGKKGGVNIQGNYMNKYNIAQPQFINNNYTNKQVLVCNVCKKNLNNNFEHEEKTQKITHKKFPYSEKIYDQYYPTYENRFQNVKKTNRGKYGKYQNNKVKVEIIYDEYTPIKLDYELGKPYQFKSKITKTSEKKEEVLITQEKVLLNNIPATNPNLMKEVEDLNKQQIIEENQEKNEVLVSNENQNIEVQENKEIIEKQNIDEQHHEMEEQQEKLEPYINEEDNAEQDNEENIEEQQYEEEQDENPIMEKNEEYNEQDEEEHNYKQYRTKDLEEKPQHEIMKDSLEVEEPAPEKEIIEVKKEIKEIKEIKEEDNEPIKPILKLDFGIKEKYEGKEDFNIAKGLKINYDDDKVKAEKHKDNKGINIENVKEIKEVKEIIEVKAIKEEGNEPIKQILKLDFGIKEKYEGKEDFNIAKGLKINYEDDQDKHEKKTIEKSNEFEQNEQKEENQEKIVINEQEQQIILNDENQNLEQNEENAEEEMNYENQENVNDENGMEIENGNEGQLEEMAEAKFKENEEEMQYEGEEEYNYEEEEQKDGFEGQEEDNENQMEEENQEVEGEFHEEHEGEN